LAGVFINYRFADERFGAGAVYDAMAQRFGSNLVFRDCVSMPAGDHYPTDLRQGLEHAEILIAIIGPNWLTGRDEDGVRWLDRPGDWVRYEIGRALERGIPIVPVITAGAAQPLMTDLPGDIVAMAALQSHHLDHAHLAADVGGSPTVSPNWFPTWPSVNCSPRANRCWSTNPARCCAPSTEWCRSPAVRSSSPDCSPGRPHRRRCRCGW
jgi:hypothetical protein